MKYSEHYDQDNGANIAMITIGDLEMVGVGMTDEMKEIFKKSRESRKVSDKIHALLEVAKRIESER